MALRKYKPITAGTRWRIGMLVCAHIVLKEQEMADEALKIQIQNWFKSSAAPYKYPRVINFVTSLPKTETGKIQRFKLK